MLNTKNDDTPPEIHKACEDIVALSFHNPLEAIRQATELCSQHENLSFVHYTRGQALALHLSNLFRTDKTKKKHLTEAIISFQRAVNMHQESPEYSYNLAHALFQNAKLSHAHADYDKALQECERGLGLHAFTQVRRMDEEKKKNYDCLKKDFEDLVETVKAARDHGFVDTKNVHEKTEVLKGKCDRIIERNQEFVKKTGEYWCKLSYDEKCRILDAKVQDFARFYGSGKNKNLKALSILMEGVFMYREKGHWVTWVCCFCKEERKKHDFDVWSSIENHIDNHFDDSEPMLNGDFDYKCDGDFDSLEIMDGVFVLHNVLDRHGISRKKYDGLLTNNKLLWEWLTNAFDVEMQLQFWEQKVILNSETASKVFKQIQEMYQVLEKLEKEKKAAAEDTQIVLSNNINSLKEAIIKFKREAVHLSIRDCREVIVPLVKYFIQATIECEADRQTRIEADELIKDEPPANKKVPNSSKTNKRDAQQEREFKEDGSESEVSQEIIQESSESQMQYEFQDPSADSERESPATNVQETTILFGTFPVTLRIWESNQEEIAQEAVDHPPENVDNDDNADWAEITRERLKKLGLNAEL